MSIVNPPDPQTTDTDAPHDTSPGRRPGSLRLSWGPGLSVATSVAFFFAALAVSVSYIGSPDLRSAHTEVPGSLAAASPVAATDATDSSVPQSSDTVSAMLARAHQCAATGEWTCVIESANAVNALRGETPETQALLQQAVIKGGWNANRASQLAGHSAGDDLLQASTPQAIGERTPQGVRHGHRHSMRARLARHSLEARSASGEDPDELYRH